MLSLSSSLSGPAHLSFVGGEILPVHVGGIQSKKHGHSRTVFFRSFRPTVQYIWLLVKEREDDGDLIFEITLARGSILSLSPGIVTENTASICSQHFFFHI